MSDFGNYKYVKTRKIHHCVYCNRAIPIGTMARNFSGIWEGDWQNWYTCGFCEKEVEPNYAEPSDGISGDEFSNWLYESDYVICKKCNGNRRYSAEWDWIDITHIKVTCGDCWHEWIVEIPIEGEAALAAIEGVKQE